MLSTIKVKLTGVAPLLMHNGQLADKRNEFTKALASLTSAKKKTEEALDDISKAEWYGSLYQKDGVVGLPGDVVYSAVVEGARKDKRGKDAQAGVFESEAFYPLQYSGPKNLEKLFSDGRFTDVRGVAVSQKRIMRTRPIFREWSCIVSLSVQEDIIETKDVLTALEKCGALVGIGDYRPRFGRFVAEALS